MPKLHYFLIAYDTETGELVMSQEFARAAEAEEAYVAAESEHRGTSVQVVLFGSDSLETLARTHPHYFERGRRKPSTAAA